MNTCIKRLNLQALTNCCTLLLLHHENHCYLTRMGPFVAHPFRAGNFIRTVVVERPFI